MSTQKKQVWFTPKEIPQPDAKDFERFFSKIEATEINKCWQWKGGYQIGGYGSFKVKKKMVMAHRMMFRIVTGKTPTLCVLHKCDNRGCVNPFHFYEGTNADNAADATSRKRWAYGDKNASRKYPERLMRGEAVNTCKITAEDVARIRAEYIPRVTRQKDIAIRYGITQAVVSKIICRDTWKHIVP